MGFAAHLSLASDRPVTAGRMLRGVALGGEKARRHWRGEGAGVGVADGTIFATGPGERVAIFDGRIDNRADLAALLGYDAPRDDAALLLVLHARYGDQTATHIIGDYAFAIWDSRARRALLAVDPGGYRTLFFHERGGELFVASEPSGLFTEPTIERLLDERRAGEWLALLDPDDADRTLFAGIRRVPPGAQATWDDTGLTIADWWRPQALPMLRLADHRDYAAAVRDALDRAVADRVAGDARIGSNLSGGLDSATVTALAACRLADEGRGLTAFTAVPAREVADAPGRFGDEWGHAAAVAARHRNVDHVAISNHDTALAEMLDLREPAQDTPLLNVANMVWHNAIEREARDRGITVMLTGSAGNMSFSYDGTLLLAQLLRAGRVPGAVGEALAMRNTLGLTMAQAARRLIAAALPRSWHRRIKRIGGSHWSNISVIGTEFADTLGLTDRLERKGPDQRNLHPTDSRALRLLALRRAAGLAGDFANASRRLYGIDTRDPTSDRRLVELCLSIPEDQFQHRGLPRAIARTLAHDLLPPIVRDEHRKGRQSSDWAHAIEAALPALAADVVSLRASGRVPGWVDLDRIDRAITGWPGVAKADHIEWVALTRALAAARFVRRFDGSNR
ncbi:asparagine synthase-related protein [Sphingomonas sp.]|uniref:asparagine synthase-related protein n=1 Tax=Sphingomonas sp. TaxID=28214 RepID=UPI002DD68273|nr:asparagine synthase-related protein [Sphingomonas sp.]